AMVTRMSPLRKGWAATAPGIAALTSRSTSAGVWLLYLSSCRGRIVMALFRCGIVSVPRKLELTDSGGPAATEAHVVEVVDCLVPDGSLFAIVVTCLSMASRRCSMLSFA